MSVELIHRCESRGMVRRNIR